MPKLLLFAPCEKVIVSNEGPISLISLFERMEAKLPATQELPERMAVPFRWAVVSVWLREVSDEGRRFEQVTHLVAQNGELAMHTEPTEIKVANDKMRARIISNIAQFPVTDGNLSIRLLYREIGKEEWVQVAEYPIEVILERAD